MPISLIDRLRQTVLDELRAVQPSNRWKVLVLDRKSRAFLETLLNVDKLYDESVTDVQMIEDVRDEDNTFEAIYLLIARPQTIKCLVHDLRQPAMYKTTHLIFVNALDEMMFEAVQTFKDRVSACRELFIDFEAKESQVFSTGDRDSSMILYNPNCGPLVMDMIASTAKKLVCLCATLGEYPIVRYYRPPDSSHAARALSDKLANQVQFELDEYARTNEDFPPKTDRPRGVLLITDRNMDLQAPLLHEFTYQAMINDLLPVVDGKTYEYTVTSAQGSEQVKETITEADAVWTSVRHMHMSIAIDKLVQDFNRFTQDNAAFSEDVKTTNLNTIRNMLAGMDSYVQGKDKYSLYITMAQECMQLFEQRQLPLTGQVEQNCAVGKTAEGKPNRGLLEALISVLDDPKVAVEDRCRLLAGYIVYKWGIYPDDRRKLCQHAQLSASLKQALENLQIVGVPPTRDVRNKATGANRKIATGDAMHNGTVSEEAFELSRFEPVLKQVARDCVRGALSTDVFPYTKDGPNSPTQPGGIGSSSLLSASNSMASMHSARGRPGAVGLASHTGSLRTNRPAWAKGRTTTEVPRQRVILFVAGGATYSEIRATYELSKELTRDVFLGATNIITPHDWLDTLSNLRTEREALGLLCDRPEPRCPVLEQAVKSPARPALSAGASGNSGVRSMSGSGMNATLRAASQAQLQKQISKTTSPPPRGSSASASAGAGDAAAGREKEKKKGFGLFGRKK